MIDEPRILIIEDDPLYAQTLIQMMENEGGIFDEGLNMDVDTEHRHPSEGLENVDSNVDVVVSDHDYNSHASFDGLEFLAGEAYEDDYLPDDVWKILITDRVSEEMVEELDQDIELDQYGNPEVALEEIYDIHYCTKVGDGAYDEIFNCIRSYWF